jgi:hypothetical protein
MINKYDKEIFIVKLNYLLILFLLFRGSIHEFPHHHLDFLISIYLVHCRAHHKIVSRPNNQTYLK